MQLTPPWKNPFALLMGSLKDWAKKGWRGQLQPSLSPFKEQPIGPVTRCCAVLVVPGRSKVVTAPLASKSSPRYGSVRNRYTMAIVYAAQITLPHLLAILVMHSTTNYYTFRLRDCPLVGLFEE
ncbi:hypothetical protein B0H67DRAFT_159132 [Lasiosphaeris hirsuta]|uniref:Uncharacterized protein n=1 Tax=Lasiosphaeris hirsuta TaxID=260670 RepID=A0AA40DZT2_9PEZI|nr:hypothetical protein B0H67DRAFT_159132 [Lasiosphaeris hirsuta]